MSGNNFLHLWGFPAHTRTAAIPTLSAWEAVKSTSSIEYALFKLSFIVTLCYNGLLLISFVPPQFPFDVCCHAYVAVCLPLLFICIHFCLDENCPSDKMPAKEEKR